MTTGMKHLAAYQANLLDYNAAKDRECNYIGNADAVPQLPERCLSRKAGIVRCCP